MEVNHAQSSKYFFFFLPLSYWLGALEPNSRGERVGDEAGVGVEAVVQDGASGEFQKGSRCG